jgi:hypothetical protein
LKTDSIILEYKCGEIIEHLDVHKLEDIIFIILKKLNNYYVTSIPKQNSFFLNINPFKQLIIDLFQSPYVHTICTRIPRCLDFIYIYTPIMTKFVKILSLYSDFCYLSEAYLK